ncbi:hypothetical protein MTR67_001471 [Solanum verrucosum]|uniref:Uncharacterized protein n=1 Tax=Solanum verrucosum TaxID=315347 RepID=A0AAF0PNR5_SOLVR|nr:hypothetical protein MTR67_001471 [Solanum verrucosum]
MSPNDLLYDDAEGWCKMEMNYTKGRIAELIDDSDNVAKWSAAAQIFENYKYSL